jgi:hypothetical protein
MTSKNDYKLQYIDMLATLNEAFINMPDDDQRTFRQQKEWSKMRILIKDLQAFIWYSDNEGNLRGLLDRLPSSDSKFDLYKCFLNYNRRLKERKLPSIHSGGLVPGINAAYNYVPPAPGDSDYDSDSGSSGVS